VAGEELKKSVEQVRETISRHFHVTDVRYDQEAFAFFVQVHPPALEAEFDDLRRELLDAGFIPTLLKERGGHIIYVTRRPDKKFRGLGVNIAFLIATIATTIFAGMVFVSSYDGIELLSLESIWKGALYFAAPLMLILGIHEMGHYLMARHHRVAASLPFFLPAPPILGTFGAFISLREPIPSKRVLLDIGVAGPIAGFVTAIVVTVLGLQLSAWNPRPTGDDASVYVVLGTPLVYQLIQTLVPTPSDILIHPTAFAGWVGFLVTFLNLLPAGQLDGGHISRALFGDKARYVGYFVVAAMVLTSIITGYWGWIVFIIFILLMFAHPPPLNDISPLPPTRYIAGAGAIIMLLICFVPVPIAASPFNPSLDSHMVQSDINVPPDGWANATVVFNNTGNTRFDVEVELQEDHGWNVTFDARLKDVTGHKRDVLNLRKDKSTNFTTYLNLTLRPPGGADLGERETFTIGIYYQDGGGTWHPSFEKFTATVGWFELKDAPGLTHVAIDTMTDVPVTIKSRVHDGEGADPVPFSMALVLPPGIEGTVTEANRTELTVQEMRAGQPLGGVALRDNETATVRVWLYAAPGTPVGDGLVANLSVRPNGTNATGRVTLPFDVVNPIFDVGIIPSSDDVEFQKGVQKTVAFQLVSRSTVDVTVRLNYTIDSANFTIVSRVDEIVLPPGADLTKSITIDPSGEVGAASTLVVSITYGPEWNRRASAAIGLLITMPAA
jgi:membrane-associated protease RseP (regulator of RpoE activity)